MNNLTMKRDTKEAVKGAKSNRLEEKAKAHSPVSMRALSPGGAGVVRIQRKGACACGGGCPSCQENRILQTKLKVNQPGDVYEQEADHVAEQVMRMPQPAASQPRSASQPQRECTECNAVGNLQRKGEDRSGAVAPPIVHDVLRSSGQSLDNISRAFMEPRFGHDFSSVRVHTDASAKESAKAVNALAYTVGLDIVFGAGQYEPSSDRGKSLLAHELTHVVQQRGGTHSVQKLTLAGEAEQAREGAAGVHGNAGEPVHVHRHRGMANLQRMGDLSKVPPDMTCPPPTSLPAGTDQTSVQFTVFSSALSSTEKALIGGVATRWRTAGGGVPVRVDGYASTDGTDAVNWRLSCERATVVASELSSPTLPGAGPGIPSSFISTIAQGETSEFSTSLSPNRRAVITMSPRRVAPPPPPRCANPGNLRTVQLQPVFFRSSAADPSPTGTTWATGLAQANVIWGKLGVTFTELPAVTLTDAANKVAGNDLAEVTAITATRTGAGIEVFLVDNELAFTGGGRTFNLASTDAKSVLTDRAGTSNTLMAHELGHVLGLGHPGLAPPLDVEPNTIMTPTGSRTVANPTRNPIGNFNRIRFPAAGAPTCLNPDP